MFFFVYFFKKKKAKHDLIIKCAKDVLVSACTTQAEVLRN